MDQALLEAPILTLQLEPVNLEKIRQEVHSFIQKYPFQPTQVCLNDRGLGSEFNPYDGVGTAYDDESKKMKFNESDFTRWAPELEGTETLAQIRKLEDVGFKVGRARFMLLRPRSCYSFHHDVTERIHLVIQPDPRAVMLFLPNTILNIPCDSRFHLVDTTRTHSAMNGGNNDRIHLVIALAEDQPDSKPSS